MIREALTDDQFHTLVEEQVQRAPQKPSIPPRANFLYSLEVRRLSESQSKAKAMVTEMLLMLNPSEKP